LSEIQAVCDRVIIINKGKMAADDTMENLTKSIVSTNRLIVRLDGVRDEVLGAIRLIHGVKSVRADMERDGGLYDYEIVMEDGADIRVMLNEMCKEHGWSIYKMAADEMTLEDIFMRITMGEDLPNTKKKPAPVINLITAEEQRAAREAAEEAAEEAAAKAAAQAENAENEEGNE
jgi:ABC-2 type transport system ATP-binding protein